jgi:hypothetical protein
MRDVACSGQQIWMYLFEKSTAIESSQRSLFGWFEDDHVSYPFKECIEMKISMRFMHLPQAKAGPNFQAIIII